jgi:hypothetical protein
LRRRVRCLNAFGETIVDRRQNLSRLAAATLAQAQTSKAKGSSQLSEQRFLLPSNSKRLAKRLLCGRHRPVLQRDFAPDAERVREVQVASETSLPIVGSGIVLAAKIAET